LPDRPMRIQVYPNVPRAVGLGGSAALAVAVIRAVDEHFGVGLSDEQVCTLAFECEKIAHGTPSGIDNTVATYGRTLLYRRGEPTYVRPLELSEPLPLVVALSGEESLTAKMVTRVRQARERNPGLYDRVFDEIDTLALEGVQAVENNDLQQLGELMNVCQGQLNALGVSTWELEELIQVARTNGAAGAKLTGGGGGGAVVALCPDDPGRVREAISRAGYQTVEV